MILVSITTSCQKWQPASHALAYSREKLASHCEFCKRLLRLVSALLAECDEEWMTGKVYLNLKD